MLLWEIRRRNSCSDQPGWIVAWDHAEASDIARREHADLIGDPIEWMPGLGAQVFWKTDLRKEETLH